MVVVVVRFSWEEGAKDVLINLQVQGSIVPKVKRMLKGVTEENGGIKK